ncbi:MAG: MFS transporter [Dehalococcoidia bacterium]|nr:MFS transporter [Dehalococcoidia bacterium]MDP7200719.1 MFS transporter [Dehalococcoidia bacterium]
MISWPPKSEEKRRPRIFYGWWIVLVSMIVDALKQGTFNRGFTIFVLPIETELGISRSAVAMADGVGRLVGAVEGPVAGIMTDRLGPRIMIAFGGIVSGLGFILLARIDSYTTFMLVFVGVLSVGFRGGYSNATMAAVNQWFRRKKSLAMALVSTGHGVGGAFLTPLVAVLVFRLDWRWAAFISGVTIIALVVPLSVLVRRTPESMGLLPDGDSVPREPVSRRVEPRGEGVPTPKAAGPVISARAARRSSPGVDFTASEGMKTFSYWMLVIAVGLRNTVHAGVSFHLAPMMVWSGTSEPQAAFLVSLTAFGALVFNPAVGWMGDAWSKRKMSAITMAVGAVAMLMLLAGSANLWYLSLFVVLLAFAESANPLATAILGDYFGRRSFATLRGWQHLPDQIMSMTTPVWMGFVFDRTDSYYWSLVPLASMYVLATGFFWWLPRPPPPARLRGPKPPAEEAQQGVPGLQ